MYRASGTSQQLSSFVYGAHGSGHCACDAEPSLMLVLACGSPTGVEQARTRGEQQVWDKVMDGKTPIDLAI